jgi:hypothetical protein
MDQFEYEICTYLSESLNKMEFFCSPDGECTEEKVPVDKNKALTEILNEKGKQGWELVQLEYSGEDVTAFWKRNIQI